MGWLFIVTVLGLLLAVGAAAEAAGRMWLRHQRAYYVYPPGLRLRLHVDRDVLPELEAIVRFEVNSDGERGSEVPRPRSGDTVYRVLVVGGSQPEGYLLDQETSWPGALQRALAKPECRRMLHASHVHVGSIARSGVGSEAANLILERVLPRYPRLQTIIVLVGASDVLHWLEHGAALPPPVEAADVFRCHPDGPYGWRPRQLAIVEIMLRARRRLLKPIYVHQRTGRWIGKARAMRARADVMLNEVPNPAPMLDHFEIQLRSALEKAKSHADRVLLVRQHWFDKDHSPEEMAKMWHGGAGQAWHEEVKTYYSVDVLSGLMALLDRRAAQVADALGVEQLDLMPILERSLTTYYDFFHLAPAGSRGVAAAIGAAILRQPFPQARPGSRIDELSFAGIDVHSPGIVQR